MKAVGKLSVATMGTNVKAILADKDLKRMPLARIMGIARNIKATVGQDGSPTFGLVGEFLGTNIAEALAHAADPKANESDGDYTSGVLYLPGGLQELIQSPLEALLNSEEKSVANNAAIEFAMDVYSVHAANKAGYSFEAELFVDAKAADPFAGVKARIGETKLPALPAPKKAA